MSRHCRWGNGSNGLVMSQVRYRATIHDLEDASFGPGCGAGHLVENSPHAAVALRRPVAVVHARALIVARAGTHPGKESLLRFTKAWGLLVDREHAVPHDEAARLWYYYNQLFEVKALLAFSTG